MMHPEYFNAFLVLVTTRCCVKSEEERGIVAKCTEFKYNGVDPFDQISSFEKLKER